MSTRCSAPGSAPGSAPISTSTTIATAACILLGLVLLDVCPENCIFMLKLVGFWCFLYTLLWKPFMDIDFEGSASRKPSREMGVNPFRSTRDGPQYRY
jgi:hypothetical protein